MSNPLKAIEKWITEHGSATVLRDHLALVKEQMDVLKTENLKLRQIVQQQHHQIEILKQDKEKLKKENDALHISLSNEPQVRGGGSMG